VIFIVILCAKKEEARLLTLGRMIAARVKNNIKTKMA